MKKEKHMSATALSVLVAEGMAIKQGEHIVIMDLRKIIHAVADYFVICSAASERQVAALWESVATTVKQKTGQPPWHSEGTTHNVWVVLDYVDVVAHIFQTEQRSFYALEALWADARTRTVSPPITNTVPYLPPS